MHFADEYVESESWLTERIFSQLKEYNPHEKENVTNVEMPVASGNNVATATTTARQDSNNTGNANFHQQIMGNVCNENKLLMGQLAQQEIYQNPNIENFQGVMGIDTGNLMGSVASDACNQDIARLAWEAIANLNDSTKEALFVMDGDNTQRYIELMKAYAAATPHIPYEYFSVSDDVVVVNESPSPNDIENSTENTQPAAIQCTNCDQIFEEVDFEAHICDYDENKVFIKEEEDVKSVAAEEVVEPPCIRQLRENNARIRKFLKDELKIDLGGSAKKQDGPHECTMCERKFVHASGLARHMEKHALDLIPVTTNTNPSGSGLKVVTKCLLCGRVLFSTAEGMKHIADSHELSSNNENGDVTDDADEEGNLDVEIENVARALDYVVNLKELNIRDELRVTAYLKVVILNSILQCEFCDYAFSEVSDLLFHESSHDPLRGFECLSCGISVPTSKEIFLHWQAECPYAKDETRKNVNLQKYFVCNVCENKFLSHEQLYDHRYSSYHLFPRLSKSMTLMQVGCEYCGIFHESAKSIMRHHEEKHIKKVKKESTTKYRQYLCDVCGKSYTQSSHLWQHLRFHRGVKPFACKEPGCNRRFTIRPDLNDHIRKCHTGERPYHCLVCGKRFLTGSVFYQHRLIHRGERRYGCEECGKRFYRADALKNHQRIHTGEKPYGCMYCSKSFRQRGDRDKHIRARHANLDANARSMAATSKDGIPNPGSVVYVGNVAFPTSMFKPMMRDIDESMYCDK